MQTDEQFTFVTVVFETEIPLLMLQARSMALFVPDDLMHEIIVIDNTAQGLSGQALSQLSEEYGLHGDQVRVLRPEDICSLPRASGWRGQQVLKLMIANLIETDRYMVLDAKNHFVAPLRRDFIIDADGRTRMSAYSYETHPLRPALEHVLRYLDINPVEHVDMFTATVTPFVFDTPNVLTMIKSIERKGRDFVDEFVRHDLTEFFLYSGWTLTQGHSLQDVFDLSRPSCPIVWKGSANKEGIEAATRQIQDDVPIFSVHRKALAILDEQSQRVLAGFWAAHGLFPTVTDGVAFIAEFQRTYERQQRAQRRRDLWSRLRRAGSWRFYRPSKGT